MAIKQPALIIERDNRKKKKEKQLLKSPTKNKNNNSNNSFKKAEAIIKQYTNNKGTTKINKNTISRKPTSQNTTQTRLLTNKDRLTSLSNFGGVKNNASAKKRDIRTVKSTKNNNSNKKVSVGVYDIYERDGRYYYNNGKKEKEIDRNFVQNALKNNKTGVIGNYSTKGELRETDKRGNVIAKEKNILKKAGRVVKGTALGIGKGFTSIADAGMQETRNDLQKGEKIDNYKDLAKNEIKALIHGLSPTLGRNAILREAGKSIKSLWKDDNKTLGQKIVGTGLETTNAATFGDIQGLKESIRGIGAADHNADEKVKQLQNKIDEPINKRLEELEKEGYRYDPITNTLTNWNRTVGQMGPGIAVGALSKNPELAIATMGLSAKGQATERAEAAGADLDTATKMGTAAGWIEAATEKLTGGAKIFGGGALDDIVEGTINSKIKNKGVNFIAKQGYGLLGETMEETLSDLAGVMIDRGTINPKAKYTLDDFLETAKDTFGSTFILNLLTGGYGGGAYRANVQNMQNYQQQQANEVAQRVESGEIDVQEGNALLEQIKDGTYQQNRNLEQIATQERQNLIQAAQQGQITPQQYTQELQTLTNTVNQTREEINMPKELQESENTSEQNYEGLNQKEYNEIQRRYKDLIETTGFEEDFIENAKPSDIVNQLKSIKELYEGDEGFLYEAKNWESPEVYKTTKSEYDKINRLINRFEGKINQQKTETTSNQQESTQESTSNNETNDYEEYQNKVKNKIEEARKTLGDEFANNMEKQRQEYKERHQLENNVYEVTKSKPVDNDKINDSFFKEHTSDFDGKTGTKTQDGTITSMKLQKGDNLAKVTFTEGRDKIWIDELYIKNQKQGYGSEIVNAIKEYANKNGKYVEAFKELQSAKGFWDKALDRNNNVETNQNENRINDHTLEYNGYYIMSEKPNVGYEYKSLEESPRFQIYDANNDDITHNVANWVNSIDEAKQYIDNIKKLDNNTKTNKNENIPATKNENVISEEVKPQKQETTNETVNQNTETQQQESKGPEILDKMPKDQTSKWEKFKKGFNRLRHHFTDHREAWYDASRKLKNPALNSRADALDAARDKAMVDISSAQVDFNSKRYKNFIDENGNKTDMSFEKAYDIYNKIPVKDKNTFLVHQLNIDRLTQGVDQFQIPLQESQKVVAELRNKYKDIDAWAENVYQYYRNLRQKLVDSGRITQEKADEWNKTTPHYVHIQRQVDNQSGNGVSTKGGKVDSSNLIQHVKGSTKPILPIKQTTSDFTIKAMNAIQLNNLAKEWAKTAGVGSTSNNIEDINDMDDIFGIDEKVFSDNGNGNYSIVAYDKGAVVDIPITKEMYEGLKPRDLRNLPTSKVTKVQRDLITNKNPVFGLITNPIKDLQAMHFYSKFSAPKTAKTYTKLFSGRTIGKAFESNPNKVTTQDWVNLYYDAGNAANSLYNNGEFTSEKEASKGKIRKGLSKVGDFIEKGNNFMESMPRITEFVNTIESEGYTINKGDGPTLVPMKGKNPTKSVEQVIMEASHNAAEITVNFKRGGTWAKNFDKNFAVYSSPALQGASKFGRNITEAIGDAKQGDFKAATRLVSRAVAMGLAPAILNEIIYGDDDDYEELQDYQKDRYYLLKGEWFGSKEKWIRIPRGREISTIQTLARRTGDAAKGKEKAYKGYSKFAIDQVGPANPIDSNIFAPIAGAYVFNRSWSGNKIVPDSLKDADAKNQYNEKTDELSKAIGKQLNISPMKLNYVLDQYSGVLGDVGLPYITPRANNNTNNPLAAIIKDKYTFDQANSSKNVSDFYDYKRELKKSDKEEDKLKGQLMGTKAKELFALTNKKQKIQMDSNLSKKEKYEQALEIQKEINKYAKKITKEVKDADVNIEKNSATVGNHVYHKNKDGEWAEESKKTTKNREKLGLSPEKYYYYKNEESYTPPGKEYSQSITSGKNAKYNIAIVDAFNFDPSDYLEYKYKLSKIRGNKDSRGRTIRYSARNKKLKYLNTLPISAVEKAYLMKQNDKYYKGSDYNLKKAISNSSLSNKEKKELYSYLKLGR